MPQKNLAVELLGDDTLKTISRELVETVHKNVTIDWTAKESVKAKLRVMVKRILNNIIIRQIHRRRRH